MLPLPEAERRALLELARRALTEAVLHGEILEVPSPAGLLAQPAGVFVTLHHAGRLRGCLGQVEASMPVAESVARMAIAVSRQDPRFDPVTADELPGLEIEISVLSPMKPIAPEDVAVGRHGLLVRRGVFRGLLLPQVPAQYRWSRERFLEETCVKAGLPRDAWKDPETLLEAFTAEVFSEAEFRPQNQAKAG
ncbi:MAG: AmmeMemoRadiSam system protein A [Acidobacteria bacterium]|nr:AmmeMemoRadiSam system protein A [Acidobacteriota bacterium]MCL5286701.1 AmmeMemoRadiSam system protein A [Acidobacteriota bacterium]